MPRLNLSSLVRITMLGGALCSACGSSGPAGESPGSGAASGGARCSATGSCDAASCASGACFDEDRCATSGQVDYGGPSFENGQDVVVTPEGDRVVAGYFALDGETNSDRQIFVAKVDAAGAELWRRELGTAGGDYANAIVRDAAGNLYVVGASSGAFEGQPHQGQRDALVFKLDDGGTLLWSLLFGGTGSDTANGVAFDSAGNLIVVGQLAYDSVAGTRGGFVAVVTTEGQLVSNAEVIMPGLYPEVMAVSVDASGNLVLAGEVLSALTGPGDVFVQKLAPDGSELWTTRWTGAEDDWANDVAVNGAGEIFVSGTTAGILEGNPEPMNGWSLFLSRLTPAGEIAYTRTYFPEVDTRGGALVLAENGDLVMAGTILGELSLDEEALGADPLLVRACPDGEPKAAQRWSLPGDDWTWGAVETAAGAVVLAGYAYRADVQSTQTSIITVAAE